MPYANDRKIVKILNLLRIPLYGVHWISMWIFIVMSCKQFLKQLFSCCKHQNLISWEWCEFVYIFFSSKIEIFRNSIVFGQEKKVFEKIQTAKFSVRSPFAWLNFTARKIACLINTIFFSHFILRLIRKKCVIWPCLRCQHLWQQQQQKRNHHLFA